MKNGLKTQLKIAQNEIIRYSVNCTYGLVSRSIISKSYRYDLTTELNQNHSSAWYDVATEICNKRKETVIRAILEDNIEIEGD